MSAQTPTEHTSTSLNLATVLQKMLSVSDKVSDLIFSPGRPPQIELVGKLQPVEIPGVEKLSPAQTSGIAKLIIGNHEGAAESLDKFGSAIFLSVFPACAGSASTFSSSAAHTPS
jgi:twitching motility protein PilT